MDSETDIVNRQCYINAFLSTMLVFRAQVSDRTAYHVTAQSLPERALFAICGVSSMVSFRGVVSGIYANSGDFNCIAARPASRCDAFSDPPGIYLPIRMIERIGIEHLPGAMVNILSVYKKD